jgi:ABC-2 type transport system permease protein
MSALEFVATPPRPSALSNALVFGWRAVLKFKHVPEQLFDLVMTPIMFTLLFTFVFGGALAGSVGAYLQYFLPGILVQTVMFNSAYSGMGLCTDLGKGLFDRFRSLPIWSLSPFAGLMVGDVLRHTIAGGIILTIGLILGFRPEAGVLGVLAAFALLIAIGFGTGWIFITLGLIVRTPMTVMTLGFTVMFPLVRLEHHGQSRDHAGLVARLRRSESGVAHHHRHARAHGWRGDASRGVARAHRAGGDDAAARAGHALAVSPTLTWSRRDPPFPPAYSRNCG